MGIRETAAKPKMVLPPGEQHGLVRGLRALTAFLLKMLSSDIKKERNIDI